MSQWIVNVHCKHWGYLAYFISGLWNPGHYLITSKLLNHKSRLIHHLLLISYAQQQNSDELLPVVGHILIYSTAQIMTSWYYITLAFLQIYFLVSTFFILIKLPFKFIMPMTSYIQSGVRSNNVSRKCVCLERLTGNYPRFRNCRPESVFTVRGEYMAMGITWRFARLK